MEVPPIQHFGRKNNFPHELKINQVPKPVPRNISGSLKTDSSGVVAPVDASLSTSHSISNRAPSPNSERHTSFLFLKYYDLIFPYFQDASPTCFIKQNKNLRSPPSEPLTTNPQTLPFPSSHPTTSIPHPHNPNPNKHIHHNLLPKPFHPQSIYQKPNSQMPQCAFHLSTFSGREFHQCGGAAFRFHPILFLARSNHVWLHIPGTWVGYKL